MEGTDVYALMVQLGDRKLAEQIEKARKYGAYSRTRPGSYLVSSSAGVLVEHLTSYLNYKGAGRTGKTRAALKSMLEDISVEAACALASRVIIDQVVTIGESSAAKLRAFLGTALEEEAQMRRVSKLAPKKFRYVKKSLLRHSKKKKTQRSIYASLVSAVPPELQGQILAWDPQYKELLAGILVTLFVRVSGLVEVRNVVRGTKRHKMVALKSSTLEWMNNATEAARSIIPLSLPLLAPPDPWVNPLQGGFHQEYQGRRPLVSSQHRIHTRVMMSSDCPEVYDGINIMQETAWKINDRVLDVFRIAMEQRWSADSLRLPNYEAEVLPEKPDVPKDDPRYKIWSREYRQAKIRIGANTLRAAQAARIEYLATVYQGQPMWFVHMLDYRGRAYPLGGGLTYQGDDRQRGLLLFNNGLPIETPIALDWYKIHGANVWGCDKLPFDERIGWVERNEKMILDVAADPIVNRDWIEADKPWQFLAWCLDYGDYHKDPKGHKSCLPVGMDGSNNGLQLYSLLLRDPVGGAATNCTPSDTPQDIYLEVARVVNAKLAAVRFDMTVEHIHRKWANQLLTFWPGGLPRAAVKRPVMTLPYGAGKHSCQHYLAEWYHDEVRGKRLNPPPFPDMDAYDALVWLGGVVWDAIGEVVLAARDCMVWLRDISDKCIEVGAAPGWVTPSGFPVLQHYKKGRSKLVNLKIGDPLAIRLTQPVNKDDARKHRNGIAPNFIHSLDAALMVRTVNRANQLGVKDFMMIHDSFATHAANAGVLADVIRDEAVSMFSEDLLENFRGQIQELVGDAFVVPPPPAYGTLDITGLLQSRYFFA